MKLFLLATRVILVIFMGTLTEQALDRQLKQFAATYAGEFEALNRTSPITNISIRHQKFIPLHAPGTIHLLVKHYNIIGLQRVYFVIVEKVGQRFVVKPHLISNDFLFHGHNIRLTPTVINRITYGNVTAQGSKNFTVTSHPPYTGVSPQLPVCSFGSYKDLTVTVDCAYQTMFATPDKIYLFQKRSTNPITTPSWRPLVDSCAGVAL